MSQDINLKQMCVFMFWSIKLFL